MDDGFVEIAPVRAKSTKAAITITTMSRLGAADLLGLNFDAEIFARLGGGMRVRAAWNAATWEIRLRAEEGGQFTAYLPKKGTRAVLRLPLSPGLVVRPKQKEPCPHRWEGETLYLIVPPAFRKPAPPPAPGAAARASIDAARQAVPAPSFSGPGRAKS